MLSSPIQVVSTLLRARCAICLDHRRQRDPNLQRGSDSRSAAISVLNERATNTWVRGSQGRVRSHHVGLVDDAKGLAERLVAPLGRRWQHVQAVAARAETLTPAVSPEDRDVLVAAAWLHDIGYSPEIGHTHFHPLDGARYLRASHWRESVIVLVAHHSGARFEAAERGMTDQLAEFPFWDTPTLDALVTADLTTGPSGEPLSFQQRIDEILSRYSPDDPVHRTWIKAAPVMRECLKRTETRLANTQPR